MGLSLLILAAGMGSRYGGLKQLDQMGPSGETVMDYSVFDAVRAGFDRIVFVIRRDFEDEFKKVIAKRYEGKIKIDFAFQDINDLPGNFKAPADRVKPWGTGHAVYAARELLTEPFAVINADDFYGQDSYRKLASYLSNPPAPGKVRGCIAAFQLSNTLSENGSVSRGICSDDGKGHLSQVVENTKIFRKDDGKIVSLMEDGTEVELTGNEPASMNSWGFMPEMVNELEALFKDFLAAHGNELKSEFYLPFVVDTLIRKEKAEITMCHSNDSWFGVTYKEDRPMVQKALQDLVDSGAYPKQLF
ncbi:MAG: NTP transferase domain-containing protein [Lentisphaeria bacterium]|nr:NTP transferase domain-containing protein [Lentisphaeria bacterium]